MNKKFCLLLVLALFSFSDAFAQKIALGTNLVDYANLGTINLSFSGAVSKNVTLGVTGKCNPWVFNDGTDQKFMQKQWVASLDCRYWFWHVYSGWWMLFKGQFSQYNVGGVWGKTTSEEGYAYGGGLGAGYSLILGKHWNVDFGLSLWGGAKDYTLYECTYCGRILEKGWKGFIAPDNVFVSFYYVF